MCCVHTMTQVSSSSGSETGLYLSRASEHNKSTDANRAADINLYTKVLSMILAIQRLGKQRKDFSFERENVAGKSSMRMARLRACGLFGSVQGDFGIGSRKVFQAGRTKGFCKIFLQ